MTDKKKVCTRCKKLLPLGSFYLRRDIPGKRTSQCKKCRYEAVKDKPARRMSVAKAKIRYRYGVSIEHIEALRKKQRGRCKICGVHEDRISGPLNIDHCHKSGKVRGLLCGGCNTGLGRFFDNVQSLKNAIKYLTETND